MLGMLKYANDFMQLAQGVNQLKDSIATAGLDKRGFQVRQDYLVKTPTAMGTFSLIVALNDILGFCDDYDSLVWDEREISTGG
jgi:hypothetical protein